MLNIDVTKNNYKMEEINDLLDNIRTETQKCLDEQYSKYGKEFVDLIMEKRLEMLMTGGCCIDVNQVKNILNYECNE